MEHVLNEVERLVNELADEDVLNHHDVPFVVVQRRVRRRLHQQLLEDNYLTELVQMKELVAEEGGWPAFFPFRASPFLTAAHCSPGPFCYVNWPADLSCARIRFSRCSMCKAAFLIQSAWFKFLLKPRVLK